MASTGNTSSEKKRTTQSRRTASQQRTAASKPAASTGTRTSASRSSSKKRKKKKVNSAAFTEAALFIALAVALILFISNFGLAGKAGTFFAAIQFGTFGIFAYIFPVVLVVGTVIMLRKGKNSGVARVKFITAFIGAMFVCAFIEMVGGGYIKLEKLSDYYNFEVPLKKGGGIVGGAVCSFLTPAVGKVGTYIIIIVFIIIAVLIISERSIIRSLTNGSRKVINTAKDDINEYKEESEKKRAIRQEQRELKEEQQRQRRRFDQKVSGVDLSIEIPGTNRRNDILGPKQPEAENMRTSAAGRLSGPDVAEVFQNDRYSENIIEIDSDENSDESTGGIFNLPKSAHSKRDKSVAAKSNDIGPVVSDKDKSARAADDSLFARGYDKQEEYHDIHGDDSSAYADEAYTEAAYADEAYRKESVDDDIVDAYADYSQEQTSYRNESADSDYAYGEHLQELPEDDGLEQWQRQEKTDAVGRTVLESLQKQTPGTGTKHDSAGTGGADKMGTSSSASARGAQPEKTMEQVDAEIDEEVRHSEQLSEEIVEKPYEFPPVELLHRGKSTSSTSQKELRDTAVKLQQTLSNFGVRVTVSDVSCGPAVTRYEIQPEQGVKVSRIVSLADDIKLNLAAADIRIEAPIPGKAAVGIEVPNKETSGVTLRELIESKPFEESKSPIAFGVGKDIAGQVVVADIAKMPHVLIAGATGSGKSVCINTLIMSVLYKADPDEVKLIMIDPKVVELSVYNGIPHLLIPVVTDPKKAAGALNWAVGEMSRRYQAFAKYNVRDMKGYNEKIKNLGVQTEEGEKLDPMPQIIIIVDELADLMMVAPGDVEEAICRLAQLARAAGIHLVLATQRPSVNVITGLIKANMPSRIAFSVSSGVDSRTIIDMNGAEKLLGKGDMLFYPSGYQKPARVQGSFVTDKEVQQVVEYLCEHNGDVTYNQEIETHMNTVPTGNPLSGAGGNDDNENDAYFADAGRLIIEKEKASIGMLQRAFKIGFNRAARIMDQLCEAGAVGPEEGTKPRKVLMSSEEFEQYLNEKNG